MHPGALRRCNQRRIPTPPAKRRRRCGFAGLAVLCALSGGAASLAQDRDNCLYCHQYRGLSRFDPISGKVQLFYIDPAYSHRMLGPHARLSCTDCHVGDEVRVIPHRPVTSVDCTRTCHLQSDVGIERRFTHANVAEMLDQSVHSRGTLESIEFDGRALLNENQSSCLYCHDEPVFRSPAQAIADINPVTQSTFDRCDTCHLEQVPLDVQYYLRHVAARLAPARSTLEMTQVCAVCHADRDVIAQFEMKSSVASYYRSFHGKAALLGDETTASCLDCHAARRNPHLMMKHEDPGSPVFASRIADTCRTTQCHPGADVTIAATAVHLDLPESTGTLEYMVAAFFIVITILTFGPSAAIVMLELLQLVVGRHRPGHHRVQQLTRVLLATREGRLRLRRFTVNQRVQHWVLALLFTLLALTGFPMKFADQAWSAFVIDLFGGLGVARIVHHWSGIALVAGFGLHMVYAAWGLLKEMSQRRREGRPITFVQAVNDLPMWMSPVDFRKAAQLMGYLLFLRPAPPTFGRFSVKEKFEYIGVFWGTTLLGITGIMLWGEQIVSHWLGGRWFNIAAIAHTYEAFLAVIHVGILHIVNVMFQPNVFPLSRATLTGDTPAPEMAEGHSEMIEAAAKDLGVAVEGGGHE